MTHALMKTTIRTVLAGGLALGMAVSPALAHSENNARQCDKGHSCSAPVKTSQHGKNGPEKITHQAPRQTTPKNMKMPAPSAHHDNRDGRKFHQLSSHERANLPRLPKGQSYRRDGDKIVRVNDNTGAIIAMLGLFAVLANSN